MGEDRPHEVYPLGARTQVPNLDWTIAGWANLDRPNLDRTQADSGKSACASGGCGQTRGSKIHRNAAERLRPAKARCY